MPRRRPTPGQLRAARRHLEAHGEVRAELVGEAVARSWQRSLAEGLPPAGRGQGAPHASSAQLARALEREAALLAHALPVLESMLPHVRAAGAVLLLADARGMVLHTMGDDVMADRARRVALRPGALWTESMRGTNAIGTALADGRPTVIHGGEHFLARNGFLSCSAAPIVDGFGRLVGAIDVSGDQRALHVQSLPHVLGLVCLAARQVEHRLFDAEPGGALRVRLHPRREGLGTAAEGLFDLDARGRLLAASAQGLEWLALASPAPGRAVMLEQLGIDAQGLARAADAPCPASIRGRDGRTWWWQAEWHARPRASAAAARVPAPQVAQSTAGPGTEPASGVAAAAATPGAAPPLPTRPGAQSPTDALAALDHGDARMRALVERARRVSGRGIGVLLLGESGVGKEVLARALHAAGSRAAGPFVALHCASLTETLLEAELFGHDAGAFTGARSQGAPGRLRQADGGTLFLDEVGDMPPALQPRLLRVLESREVVPLGGSRAVPVDFDVVAASQRDLRAEVVRGRFRADLYYRLDGLSLRLPPLREREDLPALSASLLRRLRPQSTPSLEPEVARAFAAYRWPGNVRQLEQALRAACALLDDGESRIGWQHLPEDLADELRRVGAARD
jgi:transcriptional regulator of acetoin/glycerol metabolism